MSTGHTLGPNIAMNPPAGASRSVTTSVGRSAGRGLWQPLGGPVMATLRAIGFWRNQGLPDEDDP